MMLEMFENKLIADKVSQNTIMAYLSDIKLCLKEIDKSEDEIRFADLELWRQGISKKNAPKTINRKIVAIKNYFSFLYDMEMIEKNPSLKLKSVRVLESDIKRHEPVEMKDMEKLINACTKQNAKRNKAIIAVGLTTALRFSELSSLTVEDFRNKVFTVKTKGGKTNTLMFNELATKYVEDYLKERVSCAEDDDKEYLFTTNDGKKIDNVAINRMLKSTCKRAGLPELSIHDLRKTALSYVAKTKSIVSAQHLAGHADIKTTQIYVRSTDVEKMEVINSITF